ncbi:MAG: hypothetical protein CFE45_11170 [Burkholderiales bacterium PBB5]|nr:MAG: hypothetical protein CFE45_11170 [Burkholderiales bacterium PBB5]
MPTATHTWWTLLCAVSALNLLAWLLSAHRLHRRHAGQPQQAWAFNRWQLLLSAGYVLGCAYRSALPVFDVQRLVLVDSWASSVIVGRSVATVAELCFAAQWALLLRGTAQAVGSRPALWVSRAVLPLIGVAEVCSWHAVLTTANLGHVLEESLWGGCAALLVLSLALVWPHCQPRLRPLLATCAALGVAYVAYMFLVDVPMYWARWLADEARGQPYLSLAQGMADASARWVVSHRWDDWKSEVVWMTLYFSTAVWLSIALVHAPPPPPRPAT